MIRYHTHFRGVSVFLLDLPSNVMGAFLRGGRLKFFARAYHATGISPIFATLKSPFSRTIEWVGGKLHQVLVLSFSLQVPVLYFSELLRKQTGKLSHLSIGSLRTPSVLDTLVAGTLLASLEFTAASTTLVFFKALIQICRTTT